MIPTVIEFQLDLPIPPSVNSAYVNVVNKWTGNSKGRSLSKEAKLWKQAAAEHIKQFKWKHVDGMRRISKFENVSYHVHYILHFSTKARNDIANREKLTSDFLVENFYLKDDSLIDRMVIERSDKQTPAIVEIFIQAHCF